MGIGPSPNFIKSMSTGMKDSKRMPFDKKSGSKKFGMMKKFGTRKPEKM